MAARFALVAMAGELATEYGVTGWPAGTAIMAAADLLQVWLKTCDGAGNNERRQIHEKVSAFIERHGDSRFSDAVIELDVHIRDRAGWWRDYDGKRVYLFTADGMREALKGFDFKRALDELQQSGTLLVTKKKGEKSKPERLGGRLIRVYAINAETLEARYES